MRRGPPGPLPRGYDLPMTATAGRTWQPVGEAIRFWRERGQLSQLMLAGEVNISPRHLSYIETGRSQPGRDVILRIAGHLDVPAQARNEMLLAAGYAPVYGSTGSTGPDSPELERLRSACQQVVAGHEPHPAIAVDRGWDLVAANAGFDLLTAGVPRHLLDPPCNVLRLTLHPQGMASRIVNLRDWQLDLLGRLRRRLTSLSDPRLAALEAELRSYVPEDVARAADVAAPDILCSLRLRHGPGELVFTSAVTVLGTALDVTVSELAVKVFLPADAATARALAARRPEAEPAPQTDGRFIANW